MSWYLSPPTGTIPFHKLEEYATKRLQFLLRLVACSNRNEVEDVLQDATVVDQSDCLITNTAKDAISHHILRLALGGDHDGMSFFCESELALFKLRVEKMVPDEWIIFFESTDRFLCKLAGCAVQCSAMSDIICLFEILKECFKSWHDLSFEICGSKSSCALVSIPFHLVLSLVGRRHVHLLKGMAFVPVERLKEVFIEQFEKLMAAAAKQASLERNLAFRDERIKRLTVTLKHLLSSERTPPIYSQEQHPAIRLSDLWQSSFMFPPCMANMVQVLKEKHRLKHQDRVQLTLFLKELGLPVNDALLLWKREYSVPATTSGIKGCHHRWQGNERRYIYNIRHLYGLEGARVNYSAHSCSSIQGRSLSAGDAGGCPFVTPDKSTLESMLADCGIDNCNIDHIMKLCNDKQFGRACKSFMTNKSQRRDGAERNIVRGRSRTEIVNGDCTNCVPGCNSQNGMNRRKYSTVLRSDSDSCEKTLLHRQSNDVALKSELRYCGGLTLSRDQLVTQLDLSLPPFFKLNHPMNSAHFMRDSDVCSNVCEMCKKMSIQPMNSGTDSWNETSSDFNSCTSITIADYVSSLPSHSDSSKFLLHANNNLITMAYSICSRDTVTHSSLSLPHKFYGSRVHRNLADVVGMYFQNDNGIYSGPEDIYNLCDYSYSNSMSFAVVQHHKNFRHRKIYKGSEFTISMPSSVMDGTTREDTRHDLERKSQIHKQVRFLFKLKENKIKRLGQSQKSMHLTSSKSSLSDGWSITSEDIAVCPNWQLLEYKHSRHLVQQTKLELTAHQLPEHIVSKNESSLMNRFNIWTQYPNQIGSSSAMLNKRTPETSVISKNIITWNNNCNKFCRKSECQQEHQTQDAEMQNSVSNCRHFKTEVDVSSEGKHLSLNEIVSESNHSSGSDKCFLCKCLVSCCHGNTKLETACGSFSEKSFVIKKPRDIYWFSRKHHLQKVGSYKEIS